MPCGRRLAGKFLQRFRPISAGFWVGGVWWVVDPWGFKKSGLVDLETVPPPGSLTESICTVQAPPRVNGTSAGQKVQPRSSSCLSVATPDLFPWPDLLPCCFLVLRRTTLGLILPNCIRPPCLVTEISVLVLLCSKVTPPPFVSLVSTPFRYMGLRAPCCTDVVQSTFQSLFVPSRWTLRCRSIAFSN